MRSWQWAYRGLLPDAHLAGMSVEVRARNWHGILQEGTGTLVLEVDGDVAGFVSTGPSRDRDAVPEETGEVYAIYLVPGATGSGRGAALFAAGLDALRAARYRHATLWVLETNVRARRFYLRAGWWPDCGEKSETFGAIVARELRYRGRLT